MQAWLSRIGRQADYLVLDTQSLGWPGYRRHLQKASPMLWTEPVDPDDKRRLEDLDLAALIYNMLQ